MKFVLRFGKKRIYLDYASATPLDPVVLKVMKPYFADVFANPSALHQEAVATKKAIREARGEIAKVLAVRPEEIFFTSGGTEANNLAITGFFNHLVSNAKSLQELHAICLEIEHSSVLKCFKRLEEQGLEVDYLRVLPDGVADIDHLKEIVRPNTVFVSCMLVNNEIGTLQPVKEVAKLLRRFAKQNQTPKPILHCDASQAPLYQNVEADLVGADLLALDSSKLYGPKGVGLLYKRKEINIAPLLYGGSQEKGLRPGTLNVPGIIGFAKALELAKKNFEKEALRLSRLRDNFVKEALAKIPGARLNGSETNRIANNINIFVPGLESEFVVIKLDELGFAVSSTSACLLEDAGTSYVIKAVEEEREATGSSVRISMGKDTLASDLKKLLLAFQTLEKSKI